MSIEEERATFKRPKPPRGMGSRTGWLLEGQASILVRGRRARGKVGLAALRGPRGGPVTTLSSRPCTSTKPRSAAFSPPGRPSVRKPEFGSRNVVDQELGVLKQVTLQSECLGELLAFGQERD